MRSRTHGGEAGSDAAFGGQSASGKSNGRARVSVGNLLLYLFVGAVVLFLLVPTLIVVPMSISPQEYLEFPPSGFSLRWYGAYFSDPEWMGPTFFSLWIAGWTALISTVVGTLAAVALVRGRLPGRDLLRTIVVAPVIAPIIVVAVGIYSLFLRLGFSGTNLGFVLAHTMLATPYVVLTVSAALERFDWSLEMAALNLGASHPTAFLRVTLPLILPGVAAGAAFAFVTSFDEAVVAFFISDVDHTTLPKRIFENIDFNLSPVIAAVSTVITTASLLLLGAIEIVRTRADKRSKSSKKGDE